MIFPCAKVFSIVDRSRDLFAKVFSMMDHFTMIDRSHDQSTMEKTFAPNHFTMVDDKKLHNLIFSYDLKKKLNLNFCKWLLPENAISPWGQSWERVLLKHSCILSIARVPSALVLLTVCTCA